VTNLVETEDHRLTQRRRALEIVEQLRPPSGSAVQLNRILSADPVDLRRLNEASSGDAVLAARIVALSNSSLFGLAHPISTLEQAVMVLGAEHLRALVLGCSLVELIARRLPLVIEQRYWRRAFQVAAFSQYLASCEDYEDPPMAYLAGLLHDVGLVPLLILAASADFPGMNRLFGDDADAIRVQRDEFGTDHWQVGRTIGMQWEFPASLVEVFGAHANSDHRRHHASLVHIVGTAAEVAQVLEADTGADRIRVPGSALSAVQGLLEISQVRENNIPDSGLAEFLLARDKQRNRTLRKHLGQAIGARCGLTGQCR